MSKLFIATFVIIAAFVLLGITASLDMFSRATDDPIKKQKITVGGADVFVDIAGTVSLRTVGLSGRESLGGNEGILFVFDENGKHAIWMKDMRFPIDIIWIDDKFFVVDFVENVLPSSFPEIFEPQADARYVLEVNVGWIAEHGVRVGAQTEGILKL